MTNEMIQRCAMGGPKLSRREQLWAGIFLALGMILFAAVYVVLRKIYHARPAVEALNYMSLPGIYLLYLQLTYLRKHSAATQAIIVIGTLTSLYLIMWGACSVAMRF